MIKKLGNVVLVVNDQAKALDFYTRVLGFEKRAEFVAPGTLPGAPHWITVAPKGQDIEISLFQVGSSPDPAAAQLKPGTGPQWNLVTDDCRGDFERLKAQGVRFDESEPAEQPWGIQATLRDPDGNRFSLLQPRMGP
jgi:catechol 2,3-dioxygenase-like lactoylglutathione lyase family enzyme